MIYKKALAIANHIVSELTPHCEIINIAGSVLRQKPDCGDLEIVALPKVFYPTVGLFDEQGEPQRDPDFIKKVKGLGKILIGDPALGRMVKIQIGKAEDPSEFMDNCIALDLFIPTKEDYFRIYNIRVGDKDFSHKVLAMRWRDLGWYGTDDGLRRSDQCMNISKTDKPKWKCTSKNPTLPPVWKSDKEFWEWLGIPFVEPNKRFV